MARAQVYVAREPVARAAPYSYVRYGVELEPHLVWQWNDDPFRDDDGVGLGFRASIPVLERGPIPRFNNNLAVSFGLDWAHFSDCGPSEGGCGANDFWLPIVLQWNFFVTDWLSLFPEFGLAIQHSRWDWDGYPPDDCRRVRGVDVCRRHSSETDVRPVVWFGARFNLTSRLSLVMRVGTPSLLFGLSWRL
jgi:hypothetical protein